MSKKTTITLTAIFVFAVAVRLMAYFLLRRHENPLFWEYHEIANNFLAGKGLCCNFLGIVYYAYLEPFYPLLSAFFYKLTNHNYLIFGIANMLFSGSLIVAVFLLAKDLFCEKVGLLASFIIALHPGLIYYSTEFHPLTFDVLFFTMIVASLVRLSKMAAVKEALLAGILIGVAFLSRTTMIMFIPIAVLLSLLLKEQIRVRLKLSLCILLISLTAVTAWTVRNYVVFHKIIITRSSPGWLLWLGNNPYHTGSAMYSREKSVVDNLDQESFKNLRQMDELGQNRFFTDRAVSFIKKDPVAFATRWAKRVYYFWWFSPQAGFLYPATWLFAYKLFYLLLLIPAILAISVIVMNNKSLSGVYMFGVFLTVFCSLALSLAQTAFYVEGRHRWVTEPVLIIFAAWFYIYFLERARHFRIVRK